MLATASDLNFDGIEFRATKDLWRTDRERSSRSFIKTSAELLLDRIDETVASLKRYNISIPMVAMHGTILDADKTAIERYLDLCVKLGAQFLGVWSGFSMRLDDEVDDAAVIEQLRRFAPLAEAKGITLLMETNGVYADTKRLHNVVSSVSRDSVCVLWDFNHPYRYHNEKPEETLYNIGSYIKYAHIKNSIVVDGVTKFTNVYNGDLPLNEMMGALNSINYTGYLSVDYSIRHLLFDRQSGRSNTLIPEFADYIKGYISENAQTQANLFTVKSTDKYGNETSGKYIWERETLIDLTFPQLLDRIADTFPDQYALKYTTMDYTRTYSQLREEVDLFSRSLISLGVKKGDKVAIWATNVPQWYITFWAATKIGAVLVTVNTAYKIAETEYLLRQSDTHTLVMIDGYKDSDYVGIMNEICPELDSHDPSQPLHAKRLPSLRNIITVDSHRRGCITWLQAISYAYKTDPVEVYRRMSQIDRHDVCNMQYTSGTTGFPKGVMLTHYNVVNNGKCIGDRMNLSTADRMLIHVPMFHCFGMVLSMTACVTHGSTMCPVPAFSPRLALECINKEKITAVNGVPTMFIAMIGHKDFPSTDFSYMRTGIMAGSPCPIKVMEEVIGKMNMTEITIVFGQTESSPGCTMSKASDDISVKVGTVGSPLPAIECKIVDPVTNEDLPDDTDGEFVARGYNIMKGYYKMPAATAAAIDENGWLHTGDLARRLPDGNYKITGRIKDMIIRGGENIYPKEIEDFIYTNPQVKDVQVIGVPDRQYGEAVMAWVIPKDGDNPTEEDIKDFVRSHMAKHKTPQYVRFTDSFPMNAAGKILKYKMVQDSIELLGLQEDSRIETA
jgi:fatty-acyl-CoA synthase